MVCLFVFLSLVGEFEYVMSKNAKIRICSVFRRFIYARSTGQRKQGQHITPGSVLIFELEILEVCAVSVCVLTHTHAHTHTHITYIIKYAHLSYAVLLIYLVLRPVVPLSARALSYLPWQVYMEYIQ
jgi:hypothetical protein